MIPTPNPHSSTSEATSSITPREGSVDGWGKYGLKGQKQVSPRQRLGNSSQTTSPRMGKRIIIPFTPFATLQWWAVILLPPSGAYPCCILSPRVLPGAGISMPLRGVNLTFSKKQAKKLYYEIICNIAIVIGEIAVRCLLM